MRETRIFRRKDSRAVVSKVKMMKTLVQASANLPGEDNRRKLAADVHHNADKQQSKSGSKFVCHSSVLTVSMSRYYESLFVGC